MKVIEQMRDEKIVILISHRLASVENCKCNYVFSQGRLIGWGNHKELMRNNPEYIELVNTQKEIEELWRPGKCKNGVNLKVSNQFDCFSQINALNHAWSIILGVIGYLAAIFLTVIAGES